MHRMSSRLASFLLGFLLLCGLSAPAQATFVSQGQVLAAQQAAINAARTAALFASTANQYRQIAAQFAARAAQAPNRFVRAILQAQANAWNNAANAALSASRYWTGVAAQAQATYQALLRRFQTTTCRLLPQLPLCSVSRN